MPLRARTAVGPCGDKEKANSDNGKSSGVVRFRPSPSGENILHELEPAAVEFVSTLTVIYGFGSHLKAERPTFGDCGVLNLVKIEPLAV